MLSTVRRVIETVILAVVFIVTVTPTAAYEENEVEFSNSGPSLVVEEDDWKRFEEWFTEEEVADAAKYSIELNVFQYTTEQIQADEELIERLIVINGPYGERKSHTSHAGANPVRISAEVLRWRPLVEKYFPAGWVDWGLRIIQCESGGDPNAKNPSSSASGLFQHLPKYWPQRSASAGLAGASAFNPEANIAVAAWLLENGGASHWVCKASR